MKCFYIEDVSFSHLEKYIPEDFTPCAVICNRCTDLTEYYGLSLFDTYDYGFRLFLDERYAP